MKYKADQEDIDLKKVLSLMPWWAKEKARRYRKQKKFAEKMFGPVIKQLKFDS